MKVKELIELLSTFSPDASIVVYDEDANYKGVTITKRNISTNGEYVHISGNFCEMDEDLLEDV